ncbi:hypothetical protein JFL75_02455 [Breznakiella homolactica]|uniref:Uncharacterized protein n=2 Tax=Breznakiella homolactica TaxID=2798577 RepID=A0A7T8BCC9_9SPIR|nr:hypothetical protein JFL75_02455 [Breznakiella homolactica]
MLYLAVLWLLPAALWGQVRSFDEAYPNLEGSKKEAAFASGGILETDESPSGRLRLLPAMDTDISGPVFDRSPSFIVESLQVLPYTGGPVELLTVYNALGKVRNLKGRLYRSATKNDNIPLFEEASRIESAKRTREIPDPPDAAAVPASETIYIKLKDVNFGNSYYRADIRPAGNGLLYTLSNFKNLTYTFIPVIREEKFVAQIYIEPLTDGLLVYSIAGADVSSFISSRVHMPSAIQKRLNVIVDWMIDGL